MAWWWMIDDFSHSSVWNDEISPWSTRLSPLWSGPRHCSGNGDAWWRVRVTRWRCHHNFLRNFLRIASDTHGILWHPMAWSAPGREAIHESRFRMCSQDGWNMMKQLAEWQECVTMTVTMTVAMTVAMFISCCAQVFFGFPIRIRPRSPPGFSPENHQSLDPGLSDDETQRSWHQRTSKGKIQM